VEWGWGSHIEAVARARKPFTAISTLSGCLNLHPAQHRRLSSKTLSRSETIAALGKKSARAKRRKQRIALYGGIECGESKRMFLTIYLCSGDLR